MTKFAILGAGYLRRVLGAALLATTLAGHESAGRRRGSRVLRQYYPTANCQNYGPGNPSIQRLSEYWQGSSPGVSSLPRHQVTVTTGGRETPKRQPLGNQKAAVRPLGFMKATCRYG